MGATEDDLAVIVETLRSTATHVIAGTEMPRLTTEDGRPLSGEQRDGYARCALDIAERIESRSIAGGVLRTNPRVWR